MYIGIDDTDSEKGLCTTYLSAVLMERLAGVGRLAGLPKLVRLNPCAQFKTRGNAAVAFEIESNMPEKVREIAFRTVMEFSDLSGKNTNPGLIVADEFPLGADLFYRRAVTEILEIEDAREVLEAEEVWHIGLKKGRGLIGALAAIGARLDNDRTYELIAYRHPGAWGTPRQIDASTVWEADRITYPRTWDTVDFKNDRIVFAPHSRDPILFGIRGDDPEAIKLAFDTIKSEPIERTVLYITNQGTDAHILPGRISDVRECQSYSLRGRVADPPRAIEGGHIFFSIVDGAGALTCAAFEPTKDFRATIKKLIPGDMVEVFGAVRDGTLNLEKIGILELADQAVMEAPLCQSCGRRMKSAGKGQGYRCRRCHTKAEGPISRALTRDIEPGYYEVPPSARRHLSMQLIRMDLQGAHPSR